MSDRDKVIEELKELCEYLFHEYKVCYHGDEEDTYNRFLSANNALELLKEQEAVKPILVKLYPHDVYKCGNCGHCAVGTTVPKTYRPKYCPECGRKIKWDD